MIFASASVSATQVNVYSARHYDTDIALYDTFTEQTGIVVNLIEGGSDALIERIVNEGEYTPADILITVDAGRLWRAQERGVFQPIESSVLEERIPLHLRESEGHWFGLSKRARVIVHTRGSVLPIPIARYEDLTDDALRGRICMRSSSNIYNLSLMASLIDAHGVAEAEEWAAGVVANFARPPQGNDTSNVSAVASGECGVTISNTYYLGRWLASDSEHTQSLVNAVSVVFPNQSDRGTHVNISGAGVTRHAPNRDNAVRFLEYLSGDFAQTLFAEGNNEYPIVGEPTGAITKLGTFEEDMLAAQRLGENQSEAVRVYDRAGWR
ncbi:MAG: Fe(3+) ABC transporter substrate-binding protein [Gammaproteobacteria bacterium]|nr:Fe(3+) ABC transporter substrate-binding protein [Gammaproteobacteria bacterium]